MKSLSRILIVLLGATCSFGVLAEDEVVFATGEYPPYLSESADGFGTSAKIVTEACRRANLKLTLKFMPWSRAEHDTLQGKYIASVAWGRTPDREKQFAYSRFPVVMGAPSAAFYKRAKFVTPPVIKTWADFSNLDVVGVNSYWYKEYFENAGVKAFYVSSAELAWKLIDVDRKAIYVDSLSTGLIEAKKYMPDHAGELAYVLLPFDDPNSYIIYPRNNVQAIKLKEKLDTALESMAKDGTLYKMAEVKDQP
jgi:polar amino acid transport system substrate-binding protein